MEKNLFPKRISVAATVLTFMFLVVNLMLFYRLSSQFEQVYKEHFPVLEMNAINVRLGESLSNLTRQLIYAYDNEVYIEYNLQKSALDFNIQTYKGSLDNSKMTSKPLPSNFSRAELNELEDKIISLARSNQVDKAIRLYNSKNYENLDSKYREITQQIAENLSNERDKILQNKIQFFRFGIVFSIGFFVILTVLWTRVIMLYRKNTLQKIKTEKELSDERIKSSQNAKMASLGEMAAGLAHEVNNPLAIISGYAEALIHYSRKEKPDFKKMEKISVKMLSTTYRISQIIKGLKSFSRNSANDTYTPTLISEILDETLVFCREKFKSNGVRVEINKSHENLFIDARPVEISQVLLNLLNNAFDAISGLEEECLWIKIDINKQLDCVKLSVTDGGKGIEKEIADKILEPFFTTKGVNKGTGLGLSISRNIISKHEGRLELDQGSPRTKFDIVIPLSQSVIGFECPLSKKAA